MASTAFAYLISPNLESAVTPLQALLVLTSLAAHLSPLTYLPASRTFSHASRPLTGGVSARTTHQAHPVWALFDKASPSDHARGAKATDQATRSSNHARSLKDRLFHIFLLPFGTSNPQTCQAFVSSHCVGPLACTRHRDPSLLPLPLVARTNMSCPDSSGCGKPDEEALQEFL